MAAEGELSHDARTGHVRATFAQWERLRVPYNLILLLASIITIAVTRQTQTLDGVFLLFMVTRCVGANVAFLAGPAVEAYAGWLGLRPRGIRQVLFVLGVLLSLPFAVLSIVFYHPLGMD